ncbi:hypothetical protein LguiB_004249 [Lonicera macranthoides]
MDYTRFGPFRRSSQILHTNIGSQGKEIPQPKVYNGVEESKILVVTTLKGGKNI